MPNRVRLAAVLLCILAELAVSLDAVSPQLQSAQSSPSNPSAPAATSDGQWHHFGSPDQPAAPQVSEGAPPSSPLIVLDPAHGGSDTGAHNPNGITESDIVLEYARLMRVALEGEGLRVVLTREGNEDPSFDDRSAIANASRRAIFVSLHVSTTGAPGTARVYSLPAVQQPPILPLVGPNSFPPNAAPNPHPGLRSWDNAQEPFLDLSRRLAELVQIQLAQRFRGSPDVPSAVAIRQLRTIAAPAIAIEVSSVAVPNRNQLDGMNSPLAQAVARAVSDFLPIYAGASP